MLETGNMAGEIEAGVRHARNRYKPMSSATNMESMFGG
jgi:hypothetical protein